MTKVVALFTENLRIQDNSVLSSACTKGNVVIPVYFFDTRIAISTELGIRKTWPYRAKFLCESLQNLSHNLEKLWSYLHTIKGKSLDALVDFCVSQKVEKVYMQESVGAYEIHKIQKLRQKLSQHNISLYTIWDHTLIYKDDLPFPISDMPQVFTHFRKAVEKHADILEPLPKITHIESPNISSWETLKLEYFWYDEVTIDERRALEFQWWEDAAYNRLNHYFWETLALSEYKNTRNGLIGADYSSKFSAWLNLGCISARQVYSEIQKYEKQICKNSSTYWLVFELLWRDFFQFIFLENPKKFFKEYPTVEDVFHNEWEKRKFEKWKQGRLWVAFVDANMKELLLTGFMSNRGRQNVASYLIHDLKLDWRIWAMYFESMLVDYDVASNWWNWAYQAGVGNDPRDNRYFNIEKQQSMYDGDGAYRKLWNT